MVEDKPEENSEEKKAPEPTDAEKRLKEYDDLKNANDKVEEELIRREQLKAKIEVGGKTTGGESKEKKEETDHEYRERIEKELSEGKFNDKG